MKHTHAHWCRPCWLWIALLGGVVLGPAGVRAQEASVPATAHRAGPVTLAPVITLRDIGVDTNVYRTATRPVSDFTFTAIPTLTATTRGRRVTLSGRSDTELVYFSQQSSERSVNPALSGTAQWKLPRMTLAGTASYLNTRDRPSDEIDARLRHVERDGLIDLRIRVFPRLQIGPFARFTRIDYQADAEFGGFLLAAQLDQRSRTFGVTTQYLVTPLTAIVGTVERERNRFPVTALRDSDANRYLAGVELQPRALVSGSAMFGGAQFKSRHPLLPSYTGPVGRGNVTLRMRQSTTLGVGFERDIQYSYSDLSPYYVRGGFNASITRVLSARWNLQGSGGRYAHRYQYVERPLIDGVISNVDETMIDVGAAGRYLVRPGTEITVTLGYGERRAASLARRYSGVRFGSSVVYGF